jgi:hypothetical protein
MKPNVVANVDMLVDDNEFFIDKRNKERTRKSMTIPSSWLRNKNSMGRNCINKDLNGGPKEKILKLGFSFLY